MKRLILPAILTAFLLAYPMQKVDSQSNKPQLEQKTNKKSIQNKFVENARSYLGMKFKTNGRDTKKCPGMDCMGLPFLAYSKTTGKSWYNLSVMPSTLIKKKQLGKPVRGLDGILTDSLDYSKLKRGDVIYFLIPCEVTNDRPLAKINGENYWTWHMGIYEGDSMVIHAEPNNKVIEQKLRGIIGDALYVTRLSEEYSGK